MMYTLVFFPSYAWFLLCVCVCLSVHVCVCVCVCVLCVSICACVVCVCLCLSVYPLSVLVSVHVSAHVCVLVCLKGESGGHRQRVSNHTAVQCDHWKMSAQVGGPYKQVNNTCTCELSVCLA